MKTTWLIGCVCKNGDVFSLAVLIDRGLDLNGQTMKRIIFGSAKGEMPRRANGLHVLILYALFSSEGPKT